MSKKMAVANGSYMKDGVEKTRWVNVGVILEKNGKEFALIDPTINFAAFPREQGKDMVMVGVFEDNNQGQQAPQQGYQQDRQQAPQQPEMRYEDSQGREQQPPQQSYRR